MEVSFTKASKLVQQLEGDLSRLDGEELEDRSGFVSLQGQVSASFASLQGISKTLETMAQREVNPSKKQLVKE